MAGAEGVDLNQLVNAALAEKLSAIADGKIFPRAIEILKRAGAGNPTLPGD